MSSPHHRQQLDADLHPPLTRHEAALESDRCYFCHDAPCVTACPTGIDIPLFIRQITAGNPRGAAKTIFDENIFGGMCARVCPTETLCEEACVRNTAEEKPVRIGELQRHATDTLMQTGRQPYARAAASGKRVAVVGAGPAGLACAHRLSLHGHEVTVLDAKEKPGGLNEYGIAAYKTVDDFAQREVDYILSIGGITLLQGQRLGSEVSLASLKADYDAVFLGIGLDDTNDLAIEGNTLEGVEDAVDFIARLRQREKGKGVSVAERVVVIGGGMTAIDAAIQSKLLGADEVTLCYRRGPAHMKASDFEQDLARRNDVVLRTWLQPARIIGEGGKVVAVEFLRMVDEEGRFTTTGETVSLPCEQVLAAIGQTFVADALGGALTLRDNRIEVDADRRSSDPLVWAGGDCVLGGDKLTVAAVQDGKLAAESIHRFLTEA